jgi:hypothetical protein
MPHNLSFSSLRYITALSQVDLYYLFFPHAFISIVCIIQYRMPV